VEAEATWPQIIVAVFTGLTVLAVMAAGFGPWIAQRPRVKILDIKESSWHFTYRTDNAQISHLNGTELFLAISLKNDGLERSYVSLGFTVKSPPFFFRSNESIPINPSQRLEMTVSLHLPESEGHPNKGQTIEGTLNVEPSGNCRLHFWGTKVLKQQVSVLYDEFKSAGMFGNI